MKLLKFALFVFGLFKVLLVQAQIFYESEPNNSPLDANSVAGAIIIIGTMEGTDQDGFIWSVSDTDAQKSWSFVLSGIPDSLTKVEFFRITFTDNGKEVAKKEPLLKFTSRDGAHPVRVDELIFEPGDYLIGVSQLGSHSDNEPKGLLTNPASDITGLVVEDEDSFTDEAILKSMPQIQYRLKIIEGTSLHPKSLSKSTKQQVLKLRFGQIAIYTEEARIFSTFSIDQQQAKQGQEITGATVVGKQFRVVLKDASGNKLSQTETDKLSQFSMLDLGLGEGSYQLELSSRDINVIRTITLATTGIRAEGDELEPNNRWQQANRINFEKIVRGRASKTGDYDYYQFSVNGEQATVTQTISLQGVKDKNYTLCLLDKKGQILQCRTNKGDIELTSLSLLEGSYGLLVRDIIQGSEYQLQMKSASVRKKFQEAEPNDRFGSASSLSEKRIVKGKFSGKDRDYYRFTVSGAPQLWRVQVVGKGISRVSLINSKGSTIQRLVVPPSVRRARLSNLFLLPGTHHLLVEGKQGSYFLKVLPLGPPQKNTEIEPNDDELHAQRLSFNQSLLALLENKYDRDYFHFQLTSDEHIRLTITPPVDAKLQADLRADGEFLNRKNSKTGKEIVFEKLYRPGNYSLQILANNASAAEYNVLLERLPRFSCKNGCEIENITPSDLSDKVLPVNFKASFEIEEVAAFSPYGQKITGNLQLKNTSEKSQQIEIEGVTSDFRWQLVQKQKGAKLESGETIRIPIKILVPANAWSDWPVRISFRAYNNIGQQVETYREIKATSDAVLAEPEVRWPVPETLLGGMNAAWKSLGGRRVLYQDEKKSGEIVGVGWGFDELFNNKAVSYEGLVLRGGRKLDEVEVTVDLSGDNPQQVTGIMLDLLGQEKLARALEEFEFQLSIDGIKFHTVYKGRLKKRIGEQAFILDKAEFAKFARLKLLSSQNGRTRGSLGLGEWKVIVRPGVNILSGETINIALPERGGHVVWAKPQISSNWDEVILTEKIDGQSVRVKPGKKVAWVIGFNHERAAKISRIEWLQSNKPTATNIEHVSVYLSKDSPIGPWQKISDWQLNSTGSTLLTLKTKPWARYIKFVADVPEKTSYMLFPETIGIFEQAVDKNYLSILGEWGGNSREAFYEKQLAKKLQNLKLPQQKNNTRGNALLLRNGFEMTGQVELGKNEHWYKLRVADGENTLLVKLAGISQVGARVTVINEAGDKINLRLIKNEPFYQQYKATVKSNLEYYLKVDEPPRSVIFLWDNSGSVAPYSSIIYQAISAYVAGLRPGIDVAKLMVLGGDFLLEDWSGEPYLLQTALNEYEFTDSSSFVGPSLEKAMEALEKRSGSKAIILITDANTSRYQEVWDSFKTVRPRVFALRVNPGSWANGNEEDLMQTWAAVNNGTVNYIDSVAQMNYAFERVKILLRKPVDYKLTVSSFYEEAAGPGRLKIVNNQKGTINGAVEMILDASGSMLKKLNGKRRISIAKSVLSKIITESLAEGTPFALRVFGNKKANACDTNLEIKLKPLNSKSSIKIIKKITAKNLAKTPIADSIASIESDLRKVKGEKVIILVTDGEETCGGDTEKILKAFENKGIDIRLNIVGFAINDPQLRLQFKKWAELGGGKYFEASDETSLHRSISSALQVPYSVYDFKGVLVAEGTVGGEPLALNSGIYRVKVFGKQNKIYDRVEVEAEKEKTLNY